LAFGILYCILALGLLMGWVGSLLFYYFFDPIRSV
jgi:hypothetical protein